MVAGSVSQTYTYNNQNLLLSEALSIPGRSAPVSFHYEYTDLKYRSAITYPDNEKVSFYPNAFGQPTKVSRLTYHYANNVQYHPSGSVSTFAYGNGILHTTTIDANTNLPNVVKDMNGSSRVLYLDYAFDHNANVKSIIDGQNSAYSITSMTYDGLDRLIATAGNSGIGSTALQYDSMGNITYFSSKNRTLDYTYNYSNNRLTSVSSKGAEAKSYANFDYDDAGNVTNNSHIAMSYNLANQMTNADGNTYLYDGFNRRVKTNSDEFSAYSQDGQLLYRQDGTEHIQYMYLGSRLVAKKKNSVITSVHTDLLGSAVAETSTSRALIDPRQYYKAFGDTVSATKDDVGYTGHKFDANIGLSYMQARYYDPVIGRFYSNDPMDFLLHMEKGTGIMGFNRFAYGNNNPYKYTDPTGMYPEEDLEPMAQEQVMFAEALGYDNPDVAQDGLAQTGNDMVEAATPSRETLHTAGTATAVGLTVLAVTTPCTAACAGGATAIGTLQAADHFTQGNNVDGVLSIVPFAAGKSLQLGIKASKEITKSQIGAIGDVTTTGVIELNKER